MLRLALSAALLLSASLPVAADEDKEYACFIEGLQMELVLLTRWSDDRPTKSEALEKHGRFLAGQKAVEVAYDQPYLTDREQQRPIIDRLVAERVERCTKHGPYNFQ